LFQVSLDVQRFLDIEAEVDREEEEEEEEEEDFQGKLLLYPTILRFMFQ